MATLSPKASEIVVPAAAIGDFVRVAALGPGFGRVHSLRITFEQVRHHRLDMIAVGRMFADDPEAIPDNCLAHVFTRDAEVVSESLVVHMLAVELLDAGGRRIEVPADPTPYFVPELESPLRRTSTGALESAAVVTLGVRTVPAATIFAPRASAG